MIPSAGLDRDGPPRDTEAQQQAVVTVTVNQLVLWCGRPVTDWVTACREGEPGRDPRE